MSDSSDRWARVGTLFSELVGLTEEERTRRFREIAAMEPDVAAELEVLLAADALADELLAPLDRLSSEISLSPSPATSGPGVEPPDPYGFVGQTIGRYTVEEALGGGGMGVLYKAEDVQLRRVVALKFLPPGWNRNSRFRRQFLQEARAAAALDHPNVCTIYEVGETDEGQFFIAMAFYEGATLRRRLTDGPIPMREAIEIATQAARGLAAAHGRGIAHRDIKPANLLVTPEGIVKILDFGLATSRDTSSPESSPAMGTVSYMAPEQIRGEKADAAADLWALGVLFYEMVTGVRPFTGSSRDAIFDAVLHTDPDPPRGLRPGIPPGLEALALRLLARDPADRPVAETVVDALRDEAERLDPGPVGLRSSVRTLVRRRPRSVALASIVALAASVLLVVVLSPALIPGGPTGLPGPGTADALPAFSPEGASPVVADAGAEVNPDISPDGRLLAYVQMEEPNVADLYVRPIEGGQPRLLSEGLDGTHWAPRWSPDGTWLAFTTWVEGRSTIRVVDAMGGNRRVLLTAATGPDPSMVAWSPDGRRLAVTVADTIVVLDAGSGQRLRSFHIGVRPGHITRAEVALNPLRPHTPEWSPDGSKIAFVCCNIHYSTHAADFASTGPNNLFVLDVSGEAGDVRPLTDDIIINASPRWLPDSRHLLFVSNRSGTKDVFVLDIHDAGDIRQVTSGINAHTIDLGSDGELVYSAVTVNGNVWSAPLLPGRIATTRDAEPVTTGRHDMVEFFDISDDGGHIAFDSNRDGNHNIWVGPLGSPAGRITEDPADDWNPRFSPDGSRIVFYSMRSGNRDVFVMGTDGNGLVQVTADPGQDWWPFWVADSVLLFTSRRSGRGGLYLARERSDGSWELPRPLTPGGGTNPEVSPDRTRVLFARPSAWFEKRYILDLQDVSAPVRELSFDMEFWSEDSRSGFSIDLEPEGSWLISRRPLDGGAPTPVLRLDDHDGGFLVRNGRVFFLRRQIESDIWRMRLIRDRTRVGQRWDG